MNIEKIAVDGGYVWVDKDTKIKEGDWVCGGLGGNDIKKYGKYFADDWYKIIASSISLEGVPSYVEWLAHTEYPYSTSTPESLSFSRLRIDYFIKGYQTKEKELFDELLTKYQEGMKKGLELSKKLFTEDDIRKAIRLAKRSTGTLVMNENEIIEQLKQSKK